MLRSKKSKIAKILEDVTAHVRGLRKFWKTLKPMREHLSAHARGLRIFLEDLTAHARKDLSESFNERKCLLFMRQLTQV